MNHVTFLCYGSDVKFITNLYIKKLATNIYKYGDRFTFDMYNFKLHYIS